ncbi:MAG: hypothetical protein IJX18_02700, partial [Clostridia bacterium]|nr:hypothetical protein [Clostridia bacterium]
DECDFADLRSLRFSVEGKVREDLFIPTPEEYFALCKQYDKEAVFELKGALTDERIGRLVALVKECGWIERTTFISFYQDYLLSVKKYFPSAKAYYLAGFCTEEEDKFMVKNGIHADIQYATLSKERIERYKAQGIKINCWTVDDASAAKRLKEWGVDYITSNILE